MLRACHYPCRQVGTIAHTGGVCSICPRNAVNGSSTISRVSMELRVPALVDYRTNRFPHPGGRAVLYSQTAVLDEGAQRTRFADVLLRSSRTWTAFWFPFRCQRLE